MDTGKKILETGRYKLTYSIDTIPIDYKDISGIELHPTHLGKQKTIYVNSMDVDYEKSKVTYDITIKDNPLPLIIIGGALAGAALFGAFGYALDEVQETADQFAPYLIVGALIFLYYVYKRGI